MDFFLQNIYLFDRNRGFYQYWKDLDIDYLTNRIEKETVNFAEDKSEYTILDPEFYSEDRVKTDLTLGRLQTWYAGRDLSQLNNIITFQSLSEIFNSVDPIIVNRVSYDPLTGSYSSTSIESYTNFLEK